MALQSRAFPVLITRPEPQATRFLHDVTHRYGNRVMPILSPLLAPSYLPVEVPRDAFATVIFTSETGVRAANALGLALPKRAYCVGNRTAQVARELGFEPISADGDVDDLMQLLITHPQHAPFLHLRGRESVGNLVQGLGAAGLAAQDREIYAQQPQPLNPAAQTVLHGTGCVVVPLFSPRSAQLFRATCESLTIRASLSLVALSPSVAHALADFGETEVRIAATPTQEGLLFAMDHCFISA